MRLAQHSPAMDQAWGVIRHMSADERERAEAEAVEKAHRDMVARLRSAELLWHTKGLEEGKKAGLEEGKAVRNREVALAMLEDRLPMEQIIRFTGLSTDELKGLYTRQ